jgi:hypothetical protein
VVEGEPEAETEVLESSANGDRPRRKGEEREACFSLVFAFTPAFSPG